MICSLDGGIQASFTGVFPKAWLFGAFATFSTGKSEVKALVGRTDCSGAEGIAAEDGWK